MTTKTHHHAHHRYYKLRYLVSCLSRGLSYSNTPPQTDTGAYRSKKGNITWHIKIQNNRRLVTSLYKTAWPLVRIPSFIRACSDVTNLCECRELPMWLAKRTKRWRSLFPRRPQNRPSNWPRNHSYPPQPTKTSTRPKIWNPGLLSTWFQYR